MRKVWGFSLVEVLVALTVLALGAVILIGFQNDALRTIGLTHQQSHAVSLAEKKNE